MTALKIAKLLIVRQEEYFHYLLSQNDYENDTSSGPVLDGNTLLCNFSFHWRLLKLNILKIFFSKFFFFNFIQATIKHMLNLKTRQQIA